MDGVFNMQLGETDIDRIYRLGRWEEDKTRPLLVSFKNLEHKNTVMSNLRKLKQSVDKFRSIGIAHDLTPKERQDTKNMVEEEKCEHVANNADEPENYRFLVVGTGMRRRVIKIRKSN